MQNRSRLQSNWNRGKVKLQERYSILTDDDLYLHRGNQDEMLKKIETKIGIPKQQLLKIITNLL